MPVPYVPSPGLGAGRRCRFRLPRRGTLVSGTPVPRPSGRDTGAGHVCPKRRPMPTPTRFTVQCDGFAAEVTRRRTSRVSFRAWPDGRVTVSAPLGFTKREVEGMVRAHADEIRRLLERAMPPAAEQAAREEAARLAPGDHAWLWGERLTVRHLEGSEPRLTVRREGDVLAFIGPGELLADCSARRRAHEKLLRQELAAALPGVRAEAERLVGVSARTWRIRRMHSRWGSCRPDRGSVTIALELATHDPAHLRLVAIHETAHLLICNHGSDFRAIMDRACPGWRAQQRALDEEGMRLPRQAP